MQVYFGATLTIICLRFWECWSCLRRTMAKILYQLWWRLRCDEQWWGEKTIKWFLNQGNLTSGQSSNDPPTIRRNCNSYQRSNAPRMTTKLCIFSIVLLHVIYQIGSFSRWVMALVAFVWLPWQDPRIIGWQQDIVVNSLKLTQNL